MSQTQDGLMHKASVDAAHSHDDHQQETHAKGCQDEPVGVVANVTNGTVLGKERWRERHAHGP